MKNILSNNQYYLCLDLVPRFYVAAAIMVRCYKFAGDSESLKASTDKLFLMAKGITNPLVQSYARLYLASTLRKVSPLLEAQTYKNNYEELLLGNFCEKHFEIIKITQYFCSYQSFEILWENSFEERRF